jgi:hypothetical protein
MSNYRTLCRSCEQGSPGMESTRTRRARRPLGQPRPLFVRVWTRPPTGAEATPFGRRADPRSISRIDIPPGAGGNTTQATRRPPPQLSGRETHAKAWCLASTRPSVVLNTAPNIQFRSGPASSAASSTTGNRARWSAASVAGMNERVDSGGSDRDGLRLLCQTCNRSVGARLGNDLNGKKTPPVEGPVKRDLRSTAAPAPACRNGH